MKIHLSALTLALIAFVAGCSQEPGDKGKAAGRTAMLIHVTPYYDSNGPKVSIGEHSKRLENADAKSINQFSEDLKKEKDKLRAEVLAVGPDSLDLFLQEDDHVLNGLQAARRWLM
jgi:hypothetical protein